jgi:hypothetical protein
MSVVSINQHRDAYLHVPDPGALAAELPSRSVEFFQPRLYAVRRAFPVMRRPELHVYAAGSRSCS